MCAATSIIIYLLAMCTLPIKYSYVSKMEAAEMKVLGWMYRHTRRDKIRNKDFQDRVGVRVCGRQDEESEAEVVHACEEEMHGSSSEEVQEVDYGGFLGR